jgi:5-methylcytosine-specific restriction endonuclease McrA
MCLGAGRPCRKPGLFPNRAGPKRIAISPVGGCPLQQLHKICTHCHVEKPHEAFGTRKSWCKACCNAYQKQRRETDHGYRQAKLIRDNASRRQRLADPTYRQSVNAKRRQRYSQPGIGDVQRATRRQRHATDPRWRQAKLERHRAWLQRLRETDPVAYAAMLERKKAAERQKYATDSTYRQAVLERTGAIQRKKRADPAYRKIASARVLASYHAQTPEEKRAQNNRHHQQRRAAKAQAPAIERVDLDVLFKRDRGICQICHKRCLRKQASNDHIIPLSEGGVHTYQNCVLAHGSCNAKKGNRHNIPQQQRLFG